MNSTEGSTLQTVEALLQKIEAAITGRQQLRDFTRAVTLAQEATTAFPTDPRGWAQLVLALCLTDAYNAALRAQEDAVTACGEQWTSLHNGDCERDLFFYCVRHKLVNYALEHLDRARRDHQGDPNRLAALWMAEGRLWYAFRQYQAALMCFNRARILWERLAREDSEAPNRQWQFNCDRWHLCAMVAVHGRSYRPAQILWRSLRERKQYGSPDIWARLTLVMRYGRLGAAADRLLESPSGQNLLSRPPLRQVAQHYLTKR